MPPMLDDLCHSPIGEPLTATALAHNTGNRATGGIWAVSGPGGRAVLKHLTPNGAGSPDWPAATDPRHWNYWRREHLAYTTGAAEGYGAEAGIGAPVLLAEGARPDGSVELWLEHVDGAAGRDWTVGQLEDVARRLGRVQGRCAPEESWHSRRFLRAYAARRRFDAVVWDHPLAVRHWPRELRAGLRIVWERRFDLFAVTEALPQALCHLDVWPGNLTRRGDRPVLLDWSFLGRGAIGEDPANLIADTFLDGLQPVGRLAETEVRVTEAYLAGLADAGGVGEGEVRKAIAAAGAAKYCWLAPMMLDRLAAGRSTASANYDGESDDAAVLERRRPIFAMLVRWALRALDS